MIDAVRKSPKNNLAGQLAPQRTYFPRDELCGWHSTVCTEAPRTSYPDVQYSAVHEHAGFHFLVMVI
jgi:hypothetical protein